MSFLSPFVRSHLRKALSLKGQFTGLLWVRQLKTLKGVTSTITKEVRCVGRIGIDYENLKGVQGMRANGDLPEVNQGLPWGRWARFPYLIKHKGKDGVSKLYLRIYPSSKGCKVIYRINGQLARQEEVRPLCLASEFRDSEPLCITLGVDSLRRVRAGERAK